MASVSHASVADLVTKLHTNIESIQATLSLLISTSSTHSAELDRLQNERESKIHELRTSHANALQELAAQRQKDEEELAEQRRQEQEELEAQRQREYEELMARRKSEDEERERLLREKEEDRIRLMQEEDARREAESEEMERSLQEKVERELEELEDEMERKVEEGRQALRALDERRRAINAEIDAALNTPTVIPTIHFRSRAKRLASKGLTNGNGNYADASPSLTPVVDVKAISEVDPQEEREHTNVGAPSSGNDSVVNGSRDITEVNDMEATSEHEIQPTSVPTEQLEDLEAEEATGTEATQESDISEHGEETPILEQSHEKEMVDEFPVITEHPEPSEEIEQTPAAQEPDVDQHEEIPVNESQEGSTQPEHPLLEHTSADEIVPEPRDLDEELEASPEHDLPALEEPSVDADQEMNVPATEEATAEEESPSHFHSAAVDVQSEELTEKQEDVTGDTGEVVDERSPAHVDGSQEIAHESDAVPVDAAEHDNVEVNAEPNSNPTNGTDMIQENDTDENIATVEPSLEVLDAESESAAAILPDHEPLQERELEGSPDIEPLETVQQASETELEDPMTEIIHKEEPREIIDDVSDRVPVETDHHEDTIPETVHSELQPESHVEDSTPHETAEIASVPLTVEDIETRSISPVEGEARPQDPASEETPGTSVGDEYLSSEEYSKENFTEPEGDIPVGQGEPIVHETGDTSEDHETEQPSEPEEEAGNAPTIPNKHLNAPNTVEHSASPADLGETVELSEHGNLEGNTSKEMSEEVESEAIPQETSLPEDSVPTSLENGAEEEPASHSEPAKDESRGDVPAEENHLDEHVDENELDSTPDAADTPVGGEHDVTKGTGDVEVEEYLEDGQAATFEADVPAIDESASKEVQDEVAAEGDAPECKELSEDLPRTEQHTIPSGPSQSLFKDALDVEVPVTIGAEITEPDEKIPDNEAHVERSSTPVLETEQPHDDESLEVEQPGAERYQDDAEVRVMVHDNTDAISHETQSADNVQQDSNEMTTNSAHLPGEEAPDAPFNASEVTEREIPDWEPHGVSLKEVPQTYLEDTDNSSADTTTKDQTELASAASATSEPPNYRVDVFKYLEPETTDTNDTMEADAYDTFDEESLIDGAPLNGSTGPQEEERPSSPVQHRVVARTSHINRFAESPATVLNTDDLFDDDTDSENSDSQESDDADQEDDDDEDDETGDDFEDGVEGDSDEVIPEPAVPSKIERSFPHVVSHMPSYEFGKPKMVDPFSEGSHEQVDFSSSHRSSGLFASLVDTIKSDMPAVKQMADNGESSRSLRPDDDDEYHSLSDNSQATPRTKEVPGAFQETDGEQTPFHDTFSHHEAESLHVRSHTADSIPSFDSFAQSDIESTPSETPSSPFQEFAKQEPRIHSSWSFNEQIEEHSELKAEDLPLRAEFDPSGTKNYPRYVTPKASQANLRSPRNSRFPQSADNTRVPYSRRDSVSSMSSSPSTRKFPRTDSTEAAFAEGRPYDYPPSRTPSLRDTTPIQPSSPTQQPLPTAANSSARTTVLASLPSNGVFQKTRSLFESSGAIAPIPPSSISKPLSGYFNVGRGSSASPSPQLQRKGSMASLRSLPPPLEEDVLHPRSRDGDGKPPSPAFTIPRRDSTTSQRKSSHGSITRIENDLTPFVPSKNIRPRSSNPFLGLPRSLGAERGLEDSIHNPQRVLQHQPSLDSWGDGGASLGNGNRS